LLLPVLLVTHSISESFVLSAKDTPYDFRTLGGGIRTAQQIVIQKTRYFGSAEELEGRRKTFVNMRQGGMSFDDRVEAGLMVCGTPETSATCLARWAGARWSTCAMMFFLPFVISALRRGRSTSSIPFEGLLAFRASCV
jgi:hypothetical protein